MTQKIIGIIPARMGSSRFPGKPLADICGKAMIYHVYFRSQLAKSLDALYIATCDEEIKKYCEEYTMNVVMTKDTHERCSDRCSEALLSIEKETKAKIDMLVMIQGDEPLLHPEMIDQAVHALQKDQHAQVVNLMSKITTIEEQEDKNEVKVTVDNNGYALYFSRARIPSGSRANKDSTCFKQVCIIPFMRDALLEFSRLSPTH